MLKFKVDEDKTNCAVSESEMNQIQEKIKLNAIRHKNLTNKLKSQDE